MSAPDDATPRGAARFVYLDDATGRLPGSVWWFYQALDTGVVLGVLNARPEVDGDEHGMFCTIEYDDVQIGEPDPERPGRWRPARPLTDEETDEYVDDIRDLLHSEDYDA